MKKIKNIVILYPSYERGGATNNLNNFINYCLQKKIKLIFISNIKNKKLFNNKKNNIKLINLKKKFLFNSSTRLYTSIISIIKLIPILINSDKDSTVILSFQSHILSIIFCKIFSRKIIIRNSEDSFEATKYADNKFNAYVTLLLKYVFYRFSDGIFTNSNKSKISLKKIVKKDIKLIYNPYLKKVYPNKSNPRKNIILSVGRLCKQKNQIIILKAFNLFLKKFPNYKLILIGHGNYLYKLKKLAKNLNLKKKVIFLGWIKNAKKYYLSSKIFVFPSLYEGLPNALIDSVNYNLPPISSKCSGAEDILGNTYKNFTNRNDYHQLSNLMVTIINKYSKNLLELKKIKKKLNRFLIEKQSSKYLDYCVEILNKK